MKIHTTKGGQNLTELARSLYKLDATHAPASGVKAIDALREANPELSRNQPVPAGTMIMVPDLPGYKHQPGADPGQEVAAAAARRLREVLGQVGEALGAAFDEKEAGDKETLRQLEKMAKDKDAQSPDRKVVERVKSISGATKERAKNFREQRKVQERGLAQIGEDLAAFLKIHER